MTKHTMIRGRLVGPTSVELAEAAENVEADVEVFVHPTGVSPAWHGPSLAEFLGSLPQGERTKEDVDAQLRAERDGWERPT